MFLGYVLYVICLCVLYWGGVLFCVVYGVGVLGAICLYYVVLAFIFLMSWDFQGLLHINSFTCVLRVWIICDKSIFIILRCCFVMCCVWSRCLVSYLSLWWCICIYICGFIGCWKDLCILFFRCILWYVVRVLCSCVLFWPVILVSVMYIVYVLWTICLYDVVFAFIFVEFLIF